MLKKKSNIITVVFRLVIACFSLQGVNFPTLTETAGCLTHFHPVCLCPELTLKCWRFLTAYSLKQKEKLVFTIPERCRECFLQLSSFSETLVNDPERSCEKKKSQFKEKRH